MLTVIQNVSGQMVRLGGEEHSGWLPESATAPLPTQVREVLFNLEILFDGSGYLLCYSSQDGELCGDTWHETLREAEQAATNEFGVRAEQWQAVPS